MVADNKLKKEVIMKKTHVKRLAALLAAAAMTASMAALAACDGSEKEEAGTTPPSTSQPETPNTPNTPHTPHTPEKPETPVTPVEQPLVWNAAARYDTGFSSADGGVAEIITYNADNDKFYLVNGKTKTIDIVTLAKVGEEELSTTFREVSDRIDVTALVAQNSAQFAEAFTVGDITSVAVNTTLDVIAVAVQHTDYDKNGAIVILNYDGTFKAAYEAGVQPDMVTFAGNVALSANEGEPRLGYDAPAVDPAGSVTLADLDANSAVTLGFEGFDDKRAELVESGVIITKNVAPSKDLEPEYIATEGGRAYVSLQENNAVATIDVAAKSITSVKPLGFKDHSQAGNELDLLEDGAANPVSQSVFGVYMPDGMDAFTVDGKTYLATANEGDAREWGTYEGVEKYVLEGTKVEVLKNDAFDGIDADKKYVLGGRSFSIFDAEDMSLVFDSGSMIEKYIASSEEYKAYFNCNNDDVDLDSRSKKKGPEPEAVAIASIGDKLYANVALERQGGVLSFDITDFAKVKVAAYANSRDYSAAMAGDTAPESIAIIAGADAPNGKLLMAVANENSGTVTVYCADSEKKSYEMHATVEAAPSEKADHLIIWSVFGNGGKNDGKTSNDFITIHNPTNAAVALTGYTVRYSSLREGGERSWTDIALEGELAAGANYIIIGKDTGHASPAISFAEGEYDKKVDTLVIDNKQYTVQLVKEGKVVDALGVDDDTADANAELCEGTAVTGINKHSVVVRNSDADTDNNVMDFKVVDLKDNPDVAGDYKPSNK